MGGEGELRGTNLQQMAATQAIHVAREKALEDLGITVDKDVSEALSMADIRWSVSTPRRNMPLWSTSTRVRISFNVANEQTR